MVSEDQSLHLLSQIFLMKGKKRDRFILVVYGGSKLGAKKLVGLPFRSRYMPWGQATSSRVPPPPSLNIGDLGVKVLRPSILLSVDDPLDVFKEPIHVIEIIPLDLPGHRDLEGDYVPPGTHVGQISHIPDCG